MCQATHYLRAEIKGGLETHVRHQRIRDRNLEIKGRNDARVRHQRIRDCNLQQLAAASLNSIEEAVETINFSRAAPLDFTICKGKDDKCKLKESRNYPAI